MLGDQRHNRYPVPSPTSAHPCHICIETGLAAATSAWHWARPCHICAVTVVMPLYLLRNPGSRTDSAIPTHVHWFCAAQSFQLPIQRSFALCANCGAACCCCMEQSIWPAIVGLDARSGRYPSPMLLTKAAPVRLDSTHAALLQIPVATCNASRRSTVQATSVGSNRPAGEARLL